MPSLRLEMTFRNSEGRTNRISVDDARTDLTEEEVNAAMDEILQANLFTSTGGEFVEKSKAELVTTEVTAFDMV